jgi:hypothetical protein
VRYCATLQCKSGLVLQWRRPLYAPMESVIPTRSTRPGCCKSAHEPRHCGGLALLCGELVPCRN